MLDIHNFPYAKLDVGEEHSPKNFKLVCFSENANMAHSI